MKAYTKKSTYIRNVFNILIDLLLITTLVAIGFGIFKLIGCILKNIPNINMMYGNLISASVTIILAFISYIAKIKKYLPILLSKIKQKVYQFLSWNHNPFYALITDFNKNHLSETEEQGKFVSSAIRILKNNTQNIILISGSSGRGKTTSVMLLLNAIAHNEELYFVFSELQNRIIYFDSVNHKDAMLEYLDHSEKRKCKLIIIDNIHKYSNSFINEIMGKINNFTLHNQNAKRKALIILLYQKTDRNDALYQYIKKKLFVDGGNVFRLDRYVNIEAKNAQENTTLQMKELKAQINKIDDSFFRQYMKNIFYYRKNDSILTFLNNLIFGETTTLKPNKEKKFFVLIAAIFIGLYNGYITKKELHSLWQKNYSWFSLPQENLLIRYYVRNRVFTSFPFVRTAYIFNEQLAREFRMRLIYNDYYREKSDMMAKSAFLHCGEEIPQKWLLFLLCPSNYCQNFSQRKRIHYFEKTLSAYHLQYILESCRNRDFYFAGKEKNFSPGTWHNLFI